MAGMIVTWLQKTEKFSIPSAAARRTVSAVDGAVSRSRSRRRPPGGRGSAERCAARPAVSRPSGCRRRGRWRRGRSPRTGHSHHVAEAGQDDVRPLRDRDAVVHPAHRDDAHRTAGAVHELDVLGQVILDAVAIDRVGVPAAHLHDLVVPAGLAQCGDLPPEHCRQVGVAELVDELHRVTPRSLLVRWPRRHARGCGHRAGLLPPARSPPALRGPARHGTERRCPRPRRR